MIEQLGILLTLIQWLHSNQSDRATATQAATIQNYLEWLRRHNHKELLNAVQASAQAQSQLEQLISQRHNALLQMGDAILAMMSTNQQVLLAEFADVKAALAQVMASVAAGAASPPPDLSKEAGEILKLAVPFDGDLAVLDQPEIKLVIANPSSTSIACHLTGRHYVQAVRELEQYGFAELDNNARWIITPLGEKHYTEHLKETEP